MSEYDGLASIYDKWIIGDPASGPCLDYYVDLCIATPGSLVEFCVGTGRIAIEVCRHGRSVVGVDGSSEMLGLCRSKATEAGIGSRLQLIQATLPHVGPADMKMIGEVDLVTCPMRSIGHFMSPEDKLELMRCARRLLRPGGLFVFDHYIFDNSWARLHDGVPRLLYEEQNQEVGGLRIWDTYHYQFERQSMCCTIRMEMMDPAGTLRKRQDLPLTFSWILPEQVSTLASLAELEVVDVLGDFNGMPLDNDSEQQIWILRNPTKVVSGRETKG